MLFYPFDSQGNVIKIILCKADLLKTRMITFVKAKLKKSDGQTNIYKYEVAAHEI